MGELRDVKRPACSERQTGACRSCGLAVSQPCRGHGEPAGATNLSATGRRTPTDQVRTKRRERSVPVARQMKRSTPTARPVPSDGSDQLQSLNGCPTGEGLNHSDPPDWTEDEGPGSTPSSLPALLAESYVKLRSGSIPSWATGGERIILRSCPCNRDHAPRFLWSETLEKA